MMYYHDDPLGSTSVVTDRVGNVVQHVTYTPYGDMKAELNLGASVNYLYTGQEFDREIGLYYYGARYYDQKVGRFISADTLIPQPGDSQAYNRYSYCLNNPIEYNDPPGHSSNDADIPESQPVEVNTPEVSESKDAAPPPEILEQLQTEGAIDVNKSIVTNGKVDPSTVKDSAAVAKDSYNYWMGGELPDHIERLSRDQLGKMGLNPKDFFTKSGMKAALYFNSRTSQFMLAFAGTDTGKFAVGKDAVADVQQALGAGNDQYKEAMALGKDVYSKTQGNVMMAGYSLGGGLASAAAWATGADAITFNAAGVAASTVAPNSASAITAYYIYGEILSRVQDGTPLPNAAGNRIGLFPSSPNVSSAARHSMKEVLHAVSKL